jgi:hypothetical protein
VRVVEVYAGLAPALAQARQERLEILGNIGGKIVETISLRG